MYSEMLAEAHMVSIQRDWEAQSWSRAWKALRSRSGNDEFAVQGATDAKSTPRGSTFATGR